MFALIAFGAALLVLHRGSRGCPYPQTRHGRWGRERLSTDRTV